jgi:predicted nucleic acid-binding protein
MSNESVLLDTSFFLRFLNDRDPLFKNADDYYNYFLSKGYNLIISTISIAEYCVKGKIDELPLKNIRVLPFNIDHAQKAGLFAREVFDMRNTGQIQINPRTVIPNDTKLFAQAEVESGIRYFASSDSESKKVYSILKSSNDHSLSFDLIDISQSQKDYFQLLDI